MYLLPENKMKRKGGIMKTAIVYYSYEGNSGMIAKTIASVIKADVFEIKTVDTKKRSGLALYAWGGGQALRNKKPAIQPLPVDINSYDLFILGTPVWAASPAPALVSFLDSVKITGKKVALFCCHGGGKGKVFDKLKALLPGNTIVGEIDFVNPAKKESTDLKQKLGEWVKSIGA